MDIFKTLFGDKKTHPAGKKQAGASSEQNSGKTVPRPVSEPLPGFLVKPDDPISNMMYGAQLVTIVNRRCGYSIEINESYYNRQPEVRTQSGLFEINETHIYSKQNIPSWYAVTTLKTPTVRTSLLENSVKGAYISSKMFDEPSLLIPLPAGRSFDGYESIRMINLGEWKAFTQQKSLDESIVFCHVFQLGGQVYKDYILSARKGDYGWKLECFIQSQNDNPEIQAVDFVPPGFLFGGFCTC